MSAFSRPLIALIVLACAGLAFAQGNPTGSVEGKVTDQDGLPLPGVTVTAAGRDAGCAHDRLVGEW